MWFGNCLFIFSFSFFVFFFLQNGNGGTSDDHSVSTPSPSSSSSSFSYCTRTTSWRSVCNSATLNKSIHDWCKGLGRVNSLACRVANEFFSTLPPKEVCKITNKALRTLYNAIIRMVVTEKNVLVVGKEKYLDEVIMMKAQKRTGLKAANPVRHLPSPSLCCRLQN